MQVTARAKEEVYDQNRKTEYFPLIFHCKSRRLRYRHVYETSITSDLKSVANKRKILIACVCKMWKEAFRIVAIFLLFMNL